MPDHDWNAHYASGFMPWDSDEPDPALVETMEAGTIPPGRALEVGCGTGTNALWLAARGLDVLGVDLSPLAVDRARAKLGDAASACRFEVRDFLKDPPQGVFDFVFDRGCFHVFDAPRERKRFAALVAGVLAPGGLWLSLIGSTEGGPRDTGPPRRSVRDIANAVEPALEIVQLRAIHFDLSVEKPPAAWLCLSRVRALPAQPSTGS
ncbi:MAG: class I SAM-dependent methyltransferase [Acidobacteria bacterium]|nr:class I SAM-dependent methyltransferase [Acidobacteriota bacterium]